MADFSLQADSASHNCAIVSALLRALEIGGPQADHPDDPEAQFAWAAIQGATVRTMQCGVFSADHAAAAALLAFDHIDEVLHGRAREIDDRKVIDFGEADRELRIVREALIGIWKYLARSDPRVAHTLKPVADYVNADKFE